MAAATLLTKEQQDKQNNTAVENTRKHLTNLQKAYEENLAASKEHEKKLKAAQQKASSKEVAQEIAKLQVEKINLDESQKAAEEANISYLQARSTRNGFSDLFLYRNTILLATIMPIVGVLLASIAIFIPPVAAFLMIPVLSNMIAAIVVGLSGIVFSLIGGLISLGVKNPIDVLENAAVTPNKISNVDPKKLTDDLKDESEVSVSREGVTNVVTRREQANNSPVLVGSDVAPTPERRNSISVNGGTSTGKKLASLFGRQNELSSKKRNSLPGRDLASPVSLGVKIVSPREAFDQAKVEVAKLKAQLVEAKRNQAQKTTIEQLTQKLAAAETACKQAEAEQERHKAIIEEANKAKAAALPLTPSVTSPNKLTVFAGAGGASGDSAFLAAAVDPTESPSSGDESSRKSLTK
jgi:hypothetical protein